MSSAILILSVAVVIVFVAGCAATRIKHLTGDAFQKKAKQCEQVSSFTWTSYVGISDDGSGRAYLEYGHPAFFGKGIQITVYWTSLSELPTNLVTQLKSGTPPWTNWINAATKR